MSDFTSAPIPVILEIGAEKINGHIMKMTSQGIMVELDEIKFFVGTYMVAQIELNSENIIREKVRSVKHYDRFFRPTQTKKQKENNNPILPKKLCELHFYLLSETARVTIGKFIIMRNDYLSKNVKSVKK